MTGAVQYGSDTVFTVSRRGGVPCSVIVPVTRPAVAGSTGLAIGVATCGPSLVEAPPQPPARADSIPTATRKVARLRAGPVRVVNLSILATVNYPTPPAAAILRRTRSIIHWVLHQSTGVTCCPPTSIVKCR